MKTSLKKNYIYNLLYQILAVILPIITTPYIARVLGANGIGTYSYTISVVTYFILFGSLGINLYGQREIAYAQDNKQKRDKIFSELFIFKTIVLTITIGIFWFLFANAGEYALYYKILILEIVANIIDISWVYQGLEEFKKIVVRNTGVKLASTILIFVLIHSDQDIWLYILIYALTTLLGNLSLWFKHKKYAELKFARLNIKQHIQPTIALFIPQIAIQVYVVLDKVMLGSILDNMDEVGYYEQSQKIIKVLLTIITSIGTVMLPRIAKTFTDNNFNQIKAYIYKIFNYVYMLSVPLVFGVIVTSRNFVPLFFGPGYEQVSLIMSTMSVIIVFIGLSNVIGIQYLLPTKQQKAYTISVTAGALINLSLNFALIRNMEAIGATIATVIAEFSVTAIQFFFIRKDFDINKILKISSKYLIAGIAMFLTCILIQVIVTDNMASLTAQVIIGAIIYFLTLIILKDDFTTNAVNNYATKYITIMSKGRNNKEVQEKHAKKRRS